MVQKRQVSYKPQTPATTERESHVDDSTSTSSTQEHIRSSRSATRCSSPLKSERDSCRLSRVFVSLKILTSVGTEDQQGYPCSKNLLKCAPKALQKLRKTAQTGLQDYASSRVGLLFQSAGAHAKRPLCHAPYHYPYQSSAYPLRCHVSREKQKHPSGLNINNELWRLANERCFPTLLYLQYEKRTQPRVARVNSGTSTHNKQTGLSGVKEFLTAVNRHQADSNKT
ncbi:uncharacterized protein BP01DRAFT_131906 [Aspergillus saccharolyticus JOP 1030-1]|uniref:Uncharacterized protein n=1 Tax=Aspergillus saccharolyticus JOP 1030-1 TaxID=1450539 RepID=A0A318Z8A7_9EURO|nr:hypothetical protein BP01DRAFT_131906 [Aspergillus saccharolyticus JOP 1030-1]PYH42634.1 hypothetical protein BP01DRAFT_131906 [Aspergillus saccharolyticus JOP 1030-1]